MTDCGPFRVPPAEHVQPGPPPAFSVIVAAYQAAATIAQALDSAFDQTTPPHEVVVCDDGSTDDTARVLDAYRDRIVLVRKENGGGASAMNAAVKAATGDFVSILDADDVYGRARIQVLSALAQARPDLDILVTDAHFVVGGQRTGRFYASNQFAIDDQRIGILRSCFIIGPAVRRSRLIEIGGFDEALAIGYDWDCWIRLILDGSRAGLVESPELEYRATSGSLTSSRARNLESRLTVLEKTAQRPGLNKEEHRVLGESLRFHARRARIVRAKADLEGGKAVASLRQALLVTARDRRLPVGLRISAAVAWVSPAPVAKWIIERADA